MLRRSQPQSFIVPDMILDESNPPVLIESQKPSRGPDTIRPGLSGAPRIGRATRLRDSGRAASKSTKYGWVLLGRCLWRLIKHIPDGSQRSQRREEIFDVARHVYRLIMTQMINSLMHQWELGQHIFTTTGVSDHFQY